MRQRSSERDWTLFRRLVPFDRYFYHEHGSLPFRRGTLQKTPHRAAPSTPLSDTRHISRFANRPRCRNRRRTNASAVSIERTRRREPARGTSHVRIGEHVVTFFLESRGQRRNSGHFRAQLLRFASRSTRFTGSGAPSLAAQSSDQRIGRSSR